MEISLSKVIRWIVGLFLILMALGALMQGQIIALILALIATILCLPPLAEAIEGKLNFNLSGPLRFVVVFVLIIGVGLSVPHTTTPTTTSAAQSSSIVAQASSAQPTEAEQSVYKVGDRVVVGDIAYTVTNTRTASSIGDQYTNTKANGIYEIITLKIENTGKDSTTITSNNVKLIDSQGRSFDGDSNAWVHLTDNIVFKQVQPGLPVTGEAIFDVPAGASYNVQVSDIWGNTKQIAIGTV